MIRWKAASDLADPIQITD